MDTVFETVEAGYSVLDTLYRIDLPGGYFQCQVKAPVLFEKSFRDALLLLFVKTIPGVPHCFEYTNNDRVYQTSACFTPGDKWFPVDITVTYQDNQLLGAKVTVPYDQGINQEVNQRRQLITE